MSGHPPTLYPCPSAQTPGTPTPPPSPRWRGPHPNVHSAPHSGLLSPVAAAIPTPGLVPSHPNLPPSSCSPRPFRALPFFPSNPNSKAHAPAPNPSRAGPPHARSRPSRLRAGPHRSVRMSGNGLHQARHSPRRSRAERARESRRRGRRVSRSLQALSGAAAILLCCARCRGAARREGGA